MVERLSFSWNVIHDAKIVEIGCFSMERSPEIYVPIHKEYGTLHANLPNLKTLQSYWPDFTIIATTCVEDENNIEDDYHPQEIAETWLEKVGFKHIARGVNQFHDNHTVNLWAWK